MKPLIRTALAAAVVSCALAACSSTGNGSSPPTTAPIGLGPTTTFLGAPSSAPGSATPSTVFLAPAPISGPAATTMVP